ncbi:Putative ribosomal N-acetyltransferase YdaF [Vibrio aerogenes CECT 7868]|uniref:Putative ribosomal N-acetyltransferase YdaF n=1 Tax=Vibrio aerogenes CECT 7868 TaxID=1216006 RepID=A0A1M6F9A4_9VIBR|nr:GNAT family N-acetyltransferase [Vibrio aerogenes]SHI94250.1 Putative ribosomal N-acetyltransferase YdaF [Vibrio aerogenes CECT 7868]
MLNFLKQSDAYYIYKYLNNQSISNTYPILFPYTIEDANSYVEQEIRGRSDGSRYAFSIIMDGQFIGVSALYDVNRAINTAKIYYWIAVEFWGKGAATKAVKELVNYAKMELKLTQLETGVLKKNIVSRRVLEKNGFIVENTLVNNGKYHGKFLGETFVEMKMNL